MISTPERVQGINDEAREKIKAYHVAMHNCREYDEVSIATCDAARSSLEQYIAGLENEKRLLDELERLRKTGNLSVDPDTRVAEIRINGCWRGVLDLHLITLREAALVSLDAALRMEK